MSTPATLICHNKCQHLINTCQLNSYTSCPNLPNTSTSFTSRLLRENTNTNIANDFHQSRFKNVCGIKKNYLKK